MNTNTVYQSITDFTIIAPPSLANQPSEGQLVVKKGSTVTLKCQASGFPTPQVRKMLNFKFKNYKILLSMLCVKLAYLSL